MAVAEIEGIALTTDTIWENEFDGWSPIGQSIEISEGGTIIEEHTSGPVDGRSLEIGINNATIEQIRLLETLRNETVDSILTLTLSDGRILLGIFDHNNSPLSAEPIVKISDYTKISGLPFFKITLHLMQVIS